MQALSEEGNRNTGESCTGSSTWIPVSNKEMFKEATDAARWGLLEGFPKSKTLATSGSEIH